MEQLVGLVLFMALLFVGNRLFFSRAKSATNYVVHCAFGYYGPDRAHPGANRGDLPIKDAYRYTRREARELAANLGADVEEVSN